MTNEAAIKRALARLQKLVVQYYDENPDMLDSHKGNREEITYYGSAVVGITYNTYSGKWQNVARITLKGNGYRYGYETYFDIHSPIDLKPIKRKPKFEEA